MDNHIKHSVEYLPIDRLRPAARKARTHSEKQIAQLANAIATFGFVNPVLIDADDRLVAGHGRIAAAKALGLKTAPTLRVEHLTSDQLRAYALADNKLALNAGWDAELLRLEFVELGELALDFDLDITGFSTSEIDLALAQPLTAGEDIDDADGGRSPARSPVTQRGDLWRLGSHRLLCGDSRDPESFVALMGDSRARLVFSDPPYNVRVDGHVGGLGAVKHQEFAMASGEMTAAEFAAFLELVFANERRVSLDGALHFQCMDWRHVGEMMQAGAEVYDELKNICVWAKDNGGMGSLYRSQHELVFVWKAGAAAHLNNVELGRNGRYRTNLWSYRAATKTGANAELAMHPTVKPVAMIADAILDCSKRGDIVLDAFGGSGSTLIAADRTGRCGRLIEYEPSYCDVTIDRWQTRRGKAAVLDATGETFAEVGARRAAELDRLADAALEALV